MRRALLLLAVAACQGQSTSARTSDAAQVDARLAVDSDGGGAAADDDVAVAPEGSTDPADSPDPVEAPSADQVLQRLGAIPAWRAVVDRAQYLARRGQRGVVFGRVGGKVPGVPIGAAEPDAGPPPLAQPAELVWLLDETEGNGSLGIRVHYPDTPPRDGARVAIAGAWKVDEARRWYWEAAEVTPLPDAPPPDGWRAAPGLVVASEMPPGGWGKVRNPDKAGEGDLVAFVVTQTPVRDGDGWGVSTERWGTLLAYIRFPGEHPSYGGHDFRAADERWHLKKGWGYWIKAGKVRKREGQVPVIEAATPPVRFP